MRAWTTAFTADELAAAVPQVHVSTVYRTLGLLEEIGAVRHVHLSHGPAVYEHAASADVRHLVCEVCDRHVAVPSEVFDAVRERLARDFDFVLDGSHFAIVGRCGEHADADAVGIRRPVGAPNASATGSQFCLTATGSHYGSTVGEGDARAGDAHP